MVRIASALTFVAALTAGVASSATNAPVTTHYSLVKVASPNAPAAIGPFSQGIKVGGFLFASGAIPLDPVTGNVVAGGIEEQTRQALSNVKAVVEAAGSRLGKIAKATVFVTDLDNYGTINTIYGEFFGNHAPARSLVQVSRLPRDVLIEIEVVARL